MGTGQGWGRELGRGADRSWVGKAGPGQWDGDPLCTQGRRGPSGTRERDMGVPSRAWGKWGEGLFRIAEGG